MGGPAPAPPPPPPPPTPAPAAVTTGTNTAAAEEEKRRRRNMVDRRAAGREGTILTSGLGTGGNLSGTTGKTLLGS